MHRWSSMWRVVGLVLLVCAASTSTSRADSFPRRTITIVSPFAPGGAVDIIARILAPKVSSELGVPVVVVDKAGAGGILGTAYVVHAHPDGYTLVLQGTSPFAINIAAKHSLGFDPERDLAPVSMVTAMPNIVVVTPKQPIHSIAELVAQCKANPGKLNYGMSAIGNLGQMNGEMFAMKAGIKIVGVPYPGSAPMITDLIAGRIQISFDNLAPFLPFVKGGALRPLAVTSASRSSLLPDVPTLAESGFPGFDNTAWFAMFAPRGTPQPVLERLSQAFTKAVKDPQVVASLAKIGVEPAPRDAKSVSQQIHGDVGKFRKIISEAHIKIE